ncbi:motile sperm domain-containing protein 2-like [Dendronephthya gigantea]|uniref:motile sperm domain-containing protein 2-like n=1 Tax=Dendronephthya gigantea TaxID=151771 RepID=UPI00106C4153|nr:motile sperm domain-containing protein 2-like [Dendronephthya gigantea]
MASGTSQTQPYMDKVPELRKKFLDNHYSSDKNHFDARDISRVKTDDYFVVQFINPKQGNIEKAHKLMTDALKWRKSFGINDLTEKDIPEEILRSGVMYVHGKDKTGALTVFHRLKHYTYKGNKEMQLGYQRMAALRYEQYQRENPGGKITNVTSCEDVKLLQVDMDTNKLMINSLTTYYPDILEHMYILHYTKVFEALWKITKVLLGPIAKKFAFISNEELTTYIDKENLPVEFGGPSYVYEYHPEE